jgi:GH24 family phage-related lysozyme (muramidase)
MINNIYNDDYLQKTDDKKHDKLIYLLLFLIFCLSLFFSNQDKQVKNEETSIVSPIIDNIDEIKKTVTSSNNKGYDFFKIVMTETKRREAMGAKGKELEIYLDGDHRTIGYGCHISNLSSEWKTLIKNQGNRITEKQARKLMYDHYEQIHQAIAKDVPGLNTAQMWAVKSLTYNYGWGNVKKSKLFKLIKQKSTC